MVTLWVDLETTGLDENLHEIVELAYAVEDGPIRSCRVAHSLRNADPIALRINHYFARNLDSFPSHEDEQTWVAFVDMLPGNTLAGANVAFDARFLAKRLGVSPWHHRLFDVEVYAAGAANRAPGKPAGLSDLVEAFREQDFDIPQSDHTAAGDVAAVRAVAKAAFSWCEMRQREGVDWQAPTERQSL